MLQPGHATTSWPQHDRAALIKANNVERVLADIDADDGNRAVEISEFAACSLSLVPPPPASIAGGAGARPDHSINGRLLVPSFAPASTSYNERS